MDKKTQIFFFSLIAVGLGLGGFFLGRATYAPQKEEEMTYANFSGGSIPAKEVLDLIHNEVTAEQRAIYEIKKRITLERIKQHLLEREAKSRNMTADQLLAEYRTKHQDDPVTEEELQKYISNQGLDVGKISKLQRENTIKILQSQKVMGMQDALIEKLFNGSEMKLTIPGAP